MTLDNFELPDEIDDDELLGEFDDDDAGGGDSSGQNRIQAFEQELQQKLAILRSSRRSTEERVEAAYWLGEAGDPTAIQTLVRVYERTNDAQLKQATAYALGMFKALDEALFGGDPERAAFAQERIEAIVMRGEFGKRAAKRRGGGSLGCSLLLMLSFVALLAAGFILPGAVGTLALPANDPAAAGPTATPTSTPSATQVLIEIERISRDLRDEANNLLVQLQAISTQVTSPDCTLTFSDGFYTPPAYVTAESYPDLITLVESLNSAAGQLNRVQAAFTSYCADPAALSRQEAADLQTDVINAQITLTGLRERLGQIDFATPTPSPTGLPTETATTTATQTLTPTITLTPTPTVDANLLNREILTVQLIVDNMTQPINGPASRLLNHWQDIQRTGDTDACLDPNPQRTIPENYIPDADLLEEVPELESIASLVNIGLEQTRTSWAELANVCPQRSGARQQSASVQIQVVQNALDAFSEAQQLIDGLRER